MIITIENQLAEPLDIGFPINRTLAANGDPGDDVILGVSERDLMHGEDQGDPAYKRLQLLKQKGSITMSVAADSDDESIIDEANEL